jgi:hypothetical protein
MSKKQGDKPAGKSKYAKKVARRRREAIRLNLPPNTPWPIIWLNQ